VHLSLFRTMTNKYTIISQIITLLHISTLSCHPQGAWNQYLAKLHKYCISNAAVGNKYTIKMLHIGFMQVLTIVVEVSVFKVFKILKFSYCRPGLAHTHTHTHTRHHTHTHTHTTHHTHITHPNPPPHTHKYIYICIYVDASVVYIPPPHRVTSWEL